MDVEPLAGSIAEVEKSSAQAKEIDHIQKWAISINLPPLLPSLKLGEQCKPKMLLMCR